MTNYHLNKTAISGLQVLNSQAGYYVGTTYFDEELNYDVPHSRVSGYFKTVDEAKKQKEFLDLDDYLDESDHP